MSCPSHYRELTKSTEGEPGETEPALVGGSGRGASAGGLSSDFTQSRAESPVPPTSQTACHFRLLTVKLGKTLEMHSSDAPPQATLLSLNFLFIEGPTLTAVLPFVQTPTDQRRQMAQHSSPKPRALVASLKMSSERPTYGLSPRDTDVHQDPFQTRTQRV